MQNQAVSVLKRHEARENEWKRVRERKKVSSR